MKEQLEQIEAFMKSIARCALQTENVIDAEVSCGQWGSDKTQVVKDAIQQMKMELQFAESLILKVENHD